MGKHLVYIAGAFAIIIILCSITASSGNRETYGSKPIQSNPVKDVQINDDVKVTTNIWDYLRSQKENEVIGASDGEKTITQSKKSQQQPELTIILK